MRRAASYAPGRGWQQAYSATRRLTSSADPICRSANFCASAACSRRGILVSRSSERRQVIQPRLQPRKRVHARFAQPFRPGTVRKHSERAARPSMTSSSVRKSSQECAIGCRGLAQKLEIASNDVVDLLAPHVLEIDGDFSYKRRRVRERDEVGAPPSTPSCRIKMSEAVNSAGLSGGRGRPLKGSPPE